MVRRAKTDDLLSLPELRDWRSAGKDSRSDYTLVSTVFDALASADIDQLLREVAQIIADTLATDHVLIFETGAVHAQSCFCASIGWDTGVCRRLGAHLLERARQQESTDLELLSIGEKGGNGEVYRLSPALLREHDLTAGLFAVVRCGHGSLAVLAGDAAERAFPGESDARFLYAIVTVSSSTLSRASAELARIVSLQQVVRAKQQWETTLDALPQLVCLLDERGFVVRANRTLETWRLGDVRSIRGTHVHDMLHPGCRDASCDSRVHWERLWRKLGDTASDNSMPAEIFPGYALHLSVFQNTKASKEDSHRLQGYALLVVEEKGEGGDKHRLLADLNRELQRQVQAQSTQLRAVNARLDTEIRGHKRDAALLKESEQRYACFIENTLTGIYVIKGGRIAFCNKRFAEIFGYGRDDIYRLDLHDLFASDKQIAMFSQLPAGADQTDMELTVQGISKGGQPIWLRTSLRQIDCLSEDMIVGSVIDVTAHKNATDELQRSERELRTLSERLISAQEAERRRIAMELHDGIGQSLSAIKFGMENALRSGELAGRRSEQSVEQIVGRVRDAIEEVRRISMGLRPSLLDDLGLVATIDWYCREYRTLHPNINIEKHVRIKESEIPNRLKVVVFRIIQEALNNVAKHAGASNVSVELSKTADALRLRIEDDGRGIAPEVLQDNAGLGLSTMKERAKNSWGCLTLETAPDTGTVVQVLWPPAQGSVQ